MPSPPKQLREGYARFLRNYLPRHRARLEQLARDGQSPHTLFIGCSDSRVVPEIIVDAGPGDIFTDINIANQVHPVGSDVSSSGAAVVVAVKHLKVSWIIVCGHYKCAGVGFVLDGLGKHEPDIVAWMIHAKSIAEKTAHLPSKSEARWNAAVKENVKLQLVHLMTYECVQEGLSSNRLHIQGWIYDLQGTILILDPKSNEFEEAQVQEEARVQEDTPQ